MIDREPIRARTKGDIGPNLYDTIIQSREDVKTLDFECEVLQKQLADAETRAESAERRLAEAEERAERAIEAGAKLVGLEAGSLGYSTTNSEDRAEFLARAGLDDAGRQPSRERHDTPEMERQIRDILGGKRD